MVVIISLWKNILHPLSFSFLSLSLFFHSFTRSLHPPIIISILLIFWPLFFPRAVFEANSGRLHFAPFSLSFSQFHPLSLSLTLSLSLSLSLSFSFPEYVWSQVTGKVNGTKRVSISGNWVRKRNKSVRKEKKKRKKRKREGKREKKKRKRVEEMIANLPSS